MPRSRMFTRERHGKTRRNVGWDRGPREAAVSLTASGNRVLGTGSQALSQGLTLLRTRGEFMAFLSVGTSALDGFNGAFGICVVSENAFGVGVTAMPTPLTDASWNGWLYHHFFNVKVPGAGLIGDRDASVRFTIDSKAMRKVKQTDVIAGVLEVVEVGTATLNVFVDTRLLTQLV